MNRGITATDRALWVERLGWADLWSRHQLACLCCGVDPEAAVGRPTAEVSAATMAINAAVLAEALTVVAVTGPIDSYVVSFGPRDRNEGPQFNPADATRWAARANGAARRFPLFPFMSDEFGAPMTERSAWGAVNRDETQELSALPGLAHMLPSVAALPVAPAAEPVSAEVIVANQTPAPAIKEPVQRRAAQDAAIIASLRAAGHDPLALPKNIAGKKGIKAATRIALGNGGMWVGTVFNKAWERLTSNDDISYKA